MVWPRFDAARLSGLAVAAIVMLSPVTARGQYTWTGNANRTWDTSSLNWTLGSGNIAWVTSNPAVFGATGAGAVTVSGTQTVTGTGLTVNAAGYSFTGGPITLGSATTTFNIANDTTIGSVVAGSNQLVKTGAGTLTFTGANTYSGTTTISQGAIKIANGVSNMPGDVINNGALIFGGSAGASYSPTSRLVSGNGSLVVMDGVTLGSGAWTYSGSTSVIGGLRANTTLQVASPLANTAALSVTGGSLLNGLQSSGNDNVSNRLNPAASLSLGGTAGGGEFRMGGLSASATSATHSQQLASLSLGLGVDRIYRHGNTGTASLAFTGSGGSAYSRQTGGILTVATGNDFRVSFNEIPSGAAGAGSAAILPGAVLGDNLVGFSGAGPYLLAAASYADTGTTTWTSGSNMNVTGNVSPGSAVNVNSIRFGLSTAYTVTLPSGTSVIASGMIMNGSGGADAIITGGTITSGLANASGVNELIVVDRRQSNTRSNAGFTINSAIRDNGAQPVALTLTSASEINNVGSVVLGGSNSYSGGTVLAGVVAKFASDSAFGTDPGAAGAASPTIRIAGALTNGQGGGLRPTVSGTYTWNQNRTIEVVNTAFTLDPENGTFVMPARIGGAGSIIMPLNRGGTLVITGSNTLAGFIDPNNGSLRADEGVGLSTAANLRFGAINNNTSGGYLETSGTFTRSLGSAAGGVQWANSSLGTTYNSGGFTAFGGPLTVALGGTATLDAFVWGGAAVNTAANLWLQGAAANASLTWRNPIDLGGAARQIGVASTSQWAELAGSISNGSLTKTDAGVLRLSGANTYTGATTISGGTLQLGNGGTTGSLDPASTISIASGATLVFSRSDAYGGSFANAISGTGAVRVTSGTLVMTGSNGYTGRTTIAGGVLGVGSANALAGTGTIAFAGGALQYSEANQTDYSSRIKSSTAAIAIHTNGQSVTFASGLDSTNSSGLTKSGAGTLTLTASNAYTGTTTINSGTLQVGSGGTTGNLGAGAIVNNGSLVYNRSTGSVTFPDAGITGAGSMSVSSAGRIDFQNGLVIDLAGRQDWVASANSGLYQGFTLATSATATLRSQAGISMSGVLGSVGSDSGVLNIDTSSGNANVDLNVAIGVSAVNYSLARLSVTSGTGAITLSNTTGLSWGTGGAWIRQIALNGRDVNVSANIPYFGTITVTNSGSNSTFSGNIGTTGSTGTVFTKAGSGALTLTGTNTYAGATAISGGILRVASSGRLSNTSGITINGAGAELNYNSSAALTSPITFTQGTLSGTGTIGTAVTAGANDILSPGNSPGAQSFTSGLTWDPAGTYLWEMNDATGGNGTGWDIINVSGGSGLTINATSGTTFKIAITSLSGTAAGNAANFSATTSGSWTILSSASGISGFAANKFNLDRSAFANTSSGSFTISQVASGTNQTLVLAYNTISALSSSTSSVTGFRVMQGESTTTAVNLLNAGPDATGYSLSPAGGLSLVSGSTGTLAGGGTQAITFGYASTAATGARSGTVSFTNTGNSGDAGGSVSVSGAVVTDRVVTASVVDFGLVHLGASGTATSTFTSTGSDNDFTRITVGNGTGGGLTVSGSSDFVFNGSGGSSRTVAGTFATAGVLSGTISLANASAEAGGTLPGQVPGTTGLAYSASVFSGTATWNVAGGGSWGSGASGSWTSTGGVQAAPGTFIGYANTDVAIFAGTQGGTSTVLLNNATPSLAAISFTNTANRYVIDEGSGGSLTLATSSGKPTIDVMAGGLHEIKTAILGSAGLAKLGGGTLVLSGSNGFTGGTDAAGGTLAVNGFLGGPVDVANGATLAGSGQVGGAVTVAGGGILAPGNSPGTLTMGSGLSLADASILSFELDATNFNVGGGINDLIAVTGNFTLDGLLNVAALGAGDFMGVATGAKWTLFTYTGDLTNNGLTLNSMPSLGGDRTYAIDTSTSGVVALIVVPEPATVAMAVVGVALAAGMGARRRKTRAAGR